MEENNISPISNDNEILELNHQNPALVEIPPIPIHIREAYFFRNKIFKIEFQNNLRDLKNLERLDLSDNKIKHLIDFSDIPNLRTLDLSFNLVESIPEKLSDVAEEIYLHCNDITDSTELCTVCEPTVSHVDIEYYEYTFKSDKLKKLDLASNSLHKFPILNTPNLQELYISCNHLRDIPEFIKTLKNLKVISLENNHFEEIDCSSFPLSLTSLVLAGNRELQNIKNIELLKNLTYLDVENTRITELEAGDNVEVLIWPIK
ncbi:Malignant fibrous histiocytoma-amplified sequence 1 like protein [Cucumispora dikerogammari]|nr:Malignant fibrous histiocytoma-amplified sequence 1 like protein [Cucumispora dikerogammari]